MAVTSSFSWVYFPSTPGFYTTTCFQKAWTYSDRDGPTAMISTRPRNSAMTRRSSWCWFPKTRMMLVFADCSSFLEHQYTFFVVLITCCFRVQVVRIRSGLTQSGTSPNRTSWRSWIPWRWRFRSFSALHRWRSACFLATRTTSRFRAVLKSSSSLSFS